ncbi:MAG: UDP-N-acetylmuramate--L-alanine ligase, partial [Nitrospinota bacterium]
MLGKTRRIHLVGIGGSGMSGIGEVLLNMGYHVSGSDLVETEVTRRLRELGARLFIGHDASNTAEADVVVYSSAVSPENVEVAAARERMIPVIRRAEMLAELMRMKYSVAVAGTHGKTTTTSLVAAALGEGGLDPTAVVGGRVNSLGGSSRLGNGEFLVAEADESDGSFLRLSPTVAVVTTLDEEHLDFYEGLEAIKEAFLEFINKVPFYGFAVLCLDEVHLQDIIPRVEKRFFTYGMGAQADYSARDVEFKGGSMHFTALRQGEELGRLGIHLPGIHNVYNSLAALAVGMELEIPFDAIRRALEGFQGIERRFQVLGEARGIMLVDDYGHHPKEIICTLRAAKQGWPERRLVVAFQPHRYTRTYHLAEEFHRAFYDADLLFITSIYPAGEPPIAGVDAQQIRNGIARHGHRHVRYAPTLEELAEEVEAALRPGDLLLTLGAGDIWKVAEGIMGRLN